MNFMENLQNAVKDGAIRDMDANRICAATPLFKVSKELHDKKLSFKDSIKSVREEVLNERGS